MFADLNLQDENFNKKIDKAESRGKKLAGKLGGVFKGIGKGTLKGFGTAITAVSFGTAKIAKTITSMGSQYNMAIEDYMANFSTLLGGVGQAEEKMKFIKKYAAETPFELADIAEAQKTLLSFNVESGKSEKIIKMLGDVSLGNKEKFNSLALVFGQMSSTGRLMGQDLLQFINAGFNPLIELSKESGRSVAELKEDMAKGLISVEDVTHAFELATQKGGQFYQGLEKGSKTSTGLLSTLKDNVAELAGKITSGFMSKAKKGLIPQAMKWVEELGQAFDKNGMQGLLRVGANIFKSIANGIKSSAHEISGVIRSILPTIIDVANSILGTLVDILPDMLPMLVEGFVDLFAKVLGALPNILAQLTVGLAQGIFNVIKTGLRRMSGITAETDEEIRRIKESYEELKESFEESDKAYRNSIKNIVSQHSAVANLLDRLNELQGKGALNEEEKAEMLSIVEQLKGIEGLEFNFKVNAETGKLETVQSDINSIKDAYSQATTEMIGFLKSVSGKNRTEAEQKQVEEYIKFINDLYGETVIALNEDGTFKTIDGNLNKLQGKMKAELKQLESWSTIVDTLQEKVKNGQATDEEIQQYDEAMKKIDEFMEKHKTASQNAQENIQKEIDLLKTRNDLLLQNALQEAGNERIKEIGKEIFVAQEKKVKAERDLGYLRYNKEEATGVYEQTSNAKKIINAIYSKNELGQDASKDREKLNSSVSELKASVDGLSFLTDEQKTKLKDANTDENFVQLLQTFADDYKTNSDEKIKTQEDLIKNFDSEIKAKQEELAGVTEAQKALVQQFGGSTQQMSTAGETVASALQTAAEKIANLDFSFNGGGGGGGGKGRNPKTNLKIRPSFRATGGIFKEATLFPHANTIVGEAGAEAVIPLRDFYNRLERGLGGSGKSANITINQDFSTKPASPREIARQTKLSLDRLKFGGAV